MLSVFLVLSLSVSFANAGQQAGRYVQFFYEVLQGPELFVRAGDLLSNYNTCSASPSHVNYAEYCYQAFLLTESKTYDAARQRCTTEGGHLAVIISDKLRQRIGDVIKTSPNINRGFIALEQLQSGDTVDRHWYWRVDGGWWLAAPRGSGRIGWGSVEPNDGRTGKTGDTGKEDYGELTKSGFVNDRPFDASSVGGMSAVCQFRKPSALFPIYAEGKKLIISDKIEVPALLNIENHKICAIRCHNDPSCLAITYNSATRECQLHFDRPQDYPATVLFDDIASSVWVKA